MYFGDYLKGAVVRFAWNASGADGASITRATNGTIHVYKDGDLTTEVTTGITDTEDADSLTGLNVLAIDTANSFYTPGSEFMVVLKAATIDGKTVNAVLGTFSLQRRDSTRQVVGVAQGGAVGYVDLPTSASSVDGSYAGALVTITSGTGAGQSRYRGTAYTGSSRRFTVDPAFDVAPDNTSVVEVLVTAPAPTTTPMPTQTVSMAANVVTASALATDAVTEIQTGLATSSSIAALPTATANRDALLNWQPFTSYSLARLLRVFGILWRGTNAGQTTTTPTFTAPDGGSTVNATLDTKNNRLSVTDSASNTP